MQRSWFRITIKWLKIVAVIYVACGIGLFLLQDRLLFQPVTLKKEDKFEFTQKHREFNIPVSESSNLNIVQFYPDDTIGRGVVLYFHGNKKNISWYARYAPYFTRNGQEVWMIDYPGFGKSTGKLSEKNLYDWAAHLYHFARTRFSADSITIYGKSMGTGIAAQLATRKNCRQLILETPYYDFPSVIRHYLPFYPLGKMLHYQLPTHEYLKQVEVPITIVHGTSDRVIKYNNAARLKKSLKTGDRFITVVGGRHNDLFEFSEVTAVLDSILSR